MSDLIAWSPSMSVGIAVLDEDHRRIMSLINKLHESMSNGAGKDVMGDILTGLHVYILLHFESEEGLLQQTNYPDIESQRSEHQQMNNKTKEMIRLFREDQSQLKPVDLLLFLKDWWVGHIMNSDMKYAPHLAERGLS